MLSGARIRLVGSAFSHDKMFLIHSVRKSNQRHLCIVCDVVYRLEQAHNDWIY